jgi:hypothetical protein
MNKSPKSEILTRQQSQVKRVCDLAFILAIFLCQTVPGQSSRQRRLLDADWRFHLNVLDGNTALTPGGTHYAMGLDC